MSPKKVHVYLAGPMRGRPNFNFPAFHAAAAKLREEGYEVFNPAERDKERMGVDMSARSRTGSEAYAARKYGFKLREALLEDLAYICTYAEVLAVLPGWENSKGVAAELATAKALGLRIMFLEK
jgi:hypothetical protein